MRGIRGIEKPGCKKKCVTPGDWGRGHGQGSDKGVGQEGKMEDVGALETPQICEFYELKLGREDANLNLTLEYHRGVAMPPETCALPEKLSEWYGKFAGVLSCLKLSVVLLANASLENFQGTLSNRC